MIIDFSITNYRSIRDKQTLYLLAKKKQSDLQENKVSFENLRGFKSILSKGCVIYGHNASGKSNLLIGFYFFSDFIANSYRDVKPSKGIPVVPFLLDEDSRFKDSEFEVNFIIDNVRYNYEIKLNGTRVTYESLKAYPNAIAQDWYTRTWNNEKKDYDWYSGDAEKYGFNEPYAKKTRENVSFLSYANEEKNDKLKRIYDWFDSIIFLTGDLRNLPEIITANELKKETLGKRKALEFIRRADIGINDLKLNKKEFDSTEIPSVLPQELKEKIISEFSGTFRLESTFAHSGYGEMSYLIDFDDESEGTKKLYKMMSIVFRVLDEGGIIFYDEIENALHPLLLIEVLKLFFSDLHNPKEAQIIFTAHNTILLDVNLLNRDQIWLVEKSLTGDSKLYSILKFSPRVNESLVRGYLSGRYGAIKHFESEAFEESMKQKYKGSAND